MLPWSCTIFIYAPLLQWYYFHQPDRYAASKYRSKTCERNVTEHVDDSFNHSFRHPKTLKSYKLSSKQRKGRKNKNCRRDTQFMECNVCFSMYSRRKEILSELLRQLWRRQGVKQSKLILQLHNVLFPTWERRDPWHSIRHKCEGFSAPYTGRAR